MRDTTAVLGGAPVVDRRLIVLPTSPGEIELLPPDVKQLVAARAAQRLRRAMERCPVPTARTHAVVFAPAVRQPLDFFGTTHDAPAARWPAGDELEQRCRHVNGLAIDVEHDVSRCARGDAIPRSPPQRVGRLALESRPLQVLDHRAVMIVAPRPRR